MLLFELLFTSIVLALVVGQSRIVMRAWSARIAGRRNPAALADEPARFYINFGFEIFLMLIALWYFAGLVWIWLS